MDALPFNQLVYRRIDLEKLSLEMRRARLRLRLAMNHASAVEAVMEMDQLRRHYQTMKALAAIRHDQHTEDASYAAERDFYDQIDGQVDQQVQQFYATFLNTRHRTALESQFGSLVFRKAENFRTTVKPEVLADLAGENRLATQYGQLMSTLAVPLNGQDLSLAQIEPHLQAADRTERRQAHAALATALHSQSDQLDTIFDQLVQHRRTISRKLGFSSFTDLGYRRMERLDYRREQIDALRQNILRFFVPITTEIRRLQRRRLKLDQLFYFDLPCLYPDGNPALQVAPDGLAAAANQVAAKVSRQDPSFVQELAENGYLDLVARPGKTQGGYCETLFEARLPFILMNASGTPQDAMVLMHECGHAYAALRSFKHTDLLEYHQPTLETCEIHSTALEYLSYPHLDAFFGPAGQEAALLHMTESLLFLPYGCMVDEFQHRIYDEPTLTPADRNQVWLELEHRYQPDLDYDGAPFFSEGRAWQKKEHIFNSPFYYIDYVLAQLTALDIWSTSRKHPDRAWKKYDALCEAGGHGTFLELLQKAGLASPFEPDTIKRLAYAVCDFLAL